jgi:NAD(P)-dependent dehydrogenase (short-subunit alcohol dehydrogenase family)
LACRKRVAYFSKVDVTDFENQAAVFETALKQFGRLDYVFAFAGIGERRFVPKAGGSKFEKPDLAILNVDLTGVLYSTSLAVQAFRRQQPNRFGFRGKIATIASVCGFYTVPTLREISFFLSFFCPQVNAVKTDILSDQPSTRPPSMVFSVSSRATANTCPAKASP